MKRSRGALRRRRRCWWRLHPSRRITRPVMFDRTVTKTLVGTVVEFAWTNPHASIQLDVPN